MIMGDHKKAITTMISRRNAMDGVPSLSPMQNEIARDEDGFMDGRHAAAQDMLMAMDERSPEKMMEAMANFHDLHSAMKEQEEPGESDESDF